MCYGLGGALFGTAVQAASVLFLCAFCSNGWIADDVYKQLQDEEFAQVSLLACVMVRLPAEYVRCRGCKN